MVKDYFLYNVANKCVFTNGSVDIVNILVYAKDEFEAYHFAEEYLVSENSPWKVEKVKHQMLTLSNHFISKVGTVLE